MKPFIAMINNVFDKNGNRPALHNKVVNKYCVVYEKIDLWGCPLIDIYDYYDRSGQAKQALEKLLKGGA